jgi:hypothetical protein
MSGRLYLPPRDAPYHVMLPTVHARELRGMGQGQSTASEIQSGAAAVVTGVTGELAAVAAGTSTIIPLIGPALAGVALLVEAIMNSGCGETCIETSQWANQAEPILQQNILEYFQLPTPRAASAQAYCLSVFDQTWQGLVSRCSQPGLGSAGQRCITDRQEGACTWKQTAASPLLSIPGEPQPGDCWNWYNGYRDPIADDTEVATDAQASTPSAAVSTSGNSGGNSTLLLMAAALAVVALFGD